MPKLETTARIGAYGERVAAVFLQRRHHYRLLTRNYQTDRGEIDLICRFRKELIFVEVRTRTSEDFGLPEETIRADKQRSLLAAAQHYLSELDDPRVPYRFDAVGVILQTGLPPQCKLVPHLFMDKNYNL